MKKMKCFALSLAFLGCLAGCRQADTQRQTGEQSAVGQEGEGARMAKLDVEQLKNGESFQFGKVPWRSELREMQAAVGMMEPYGKSEEENVEQKRALPKINILGRDAEIIAEYYQGRLREVVLNTSHQNAKKAEEYAQDLLDELEALWGEGSKSEENGEEITLWKSESGNEITYLQTETAAEEKRVTIRLRCEAADGMDEASVSLKELSNGEGYRFGELPWDSSVEEIETLLDEGLISSDQMEDVEVYKLWGTRTLEEFGKQTDVQLEFHSGKLKMAAILCGVEEMEEEEEEEFYPKIISELTALYGEPQDSQSAEYGTDTFKYTVWRADDQSSLSVIRDKVIQIVVASAG